MGSHPIFLEIIARTLAFRPSNAFEGQEDAGKGKKWNNSHATYVSMFFQWSHDGVYGSPSTKLHFKNICSILQCNKHLSLNLIEIICKSFKLCVMFSLFSTQIAHFAAEDCGIESTEIAKRLPDSITLLKVKFLKETYKNDHDRSQARPASLANK